MDIVIIGGGPSGLFAAENLARAGLSVHVYDRKPALGRKFLLAGRGGLNLTHSEDLDIFITRYRERSDFIGPMIREFSPAHLRAWCEGLGQETFIGSSGRVFPKTMKASPLLRAWLARLNTLGVNFHFNRTWAGWDENANLVFEMPEGTREAVKPQATLLAVGGASWPHLGSDGSWAPLLSASGVTVSPLRPSNGGFSVAWSNHMRERFAGQPLKNIALSIGEHHARGEIMIDKDGIEGGAVYALSAIIRDTIERDGLAHVSIDLRPDMTRDKIIEKLNMPRARKSFSTWAQKTLHLSPLHTTLLRESDKNAADAVPEKLAVLIKSLPLTVTAPFPIDRAISSAGGLSPDALDDNLMITSIPGVFAAGEMVDWEAPTGGYLLQGCFATGAAAANGMLRWIGKNPA